MFIKSYLMSTIADLKTIQVKVEKFDIVEQYTTKHKEEIEVDNYHNHFCSFAQKHPNGMYRLCLTKVFITNYASGLSFSQPLQETIQ